jgi:cytochrome b
MTSSTDTIKVWDPLVRIGHWTLVTAFFVAYFTEEDLLTQHVWAGYTVAVVVIFRVLWGLVGTEFARFRNFVRGPVETVRYLADIAHNRARRFIGHNPAGGAMIVAMLASLAVTTYSGLEIYAIEENAGPLAAIADVDVPGSTDLALVSAARADDDSDSDSDRDDGEHEDAEEFWEELHEVSANLTVFLVVVHVLGVLLASFSHRENLVRAMFTGRKQA